MHATSITLHPNLLMSSVGKKRIEIMAAEEITLCDATPTLPTLFIELWRFAKAINALERNTNPSDKISKFLIILVLLMEECENCREFFAKFSLRSTAIFETTSKSVVICFIIL